MDLVTEKLTCLVRAHSLPSSNYLISRKEKRPISVIFYFVIKVSGDVKRWRSTINPCPPPAGWCVYVSVPVQLLTESMFYSQHPFCPCSPLWLLTWMFLAGKGRRTVNDVFLPLFSFSSIHSVNKSPQIRPQEGRQCYSAMFCGQFVKRKLVLSMACYTACIMKTVKMLRIKLCAHRVK